MKSYLAIVGAVLLGFVGLEISLFSTHVARQPAAKSQPAPISVAPSENANPAAPQPKAFSAVTNRNSEAAPTFTKMAGDVLKGAVKTAREIDEIGLWLTRLSAKEEMQLGADIHRRIMNDETEWNNPAALQRLERLARPILERRRRKEIAYKIRIIDSEVINAFSCAGGYVYVCRGLLEHFPSDAAIVMVLGHEIGHIDLRHCVAKIQVKVKLQRWVGSLSELAVFAYKSLRTPYAKDQEFDADGFGFDAGRRAGWPRNDLIEFFRGLQAIDADSQSTDAPPLVTKIKDFYSSHPHTAERIRRLEATPDP